jgi:hypothetical protein
MDERPARAPRLLEVLLGLVSVGYIGLVVVGLTRGRFIAPVASTVGFFVVVYGCLIMLVPSAPEPKLGDVFWSLEADGSAYWVVARKELERWEVDWKDFEAAVKAAVQHEDVVERARMNRELATLGTRAPEARSLSIIAKDRKNARASDP